MNVILLEPSFPVIQQQFARALHEAGATVIGIGGRPKQSLDGQVTGWLSHSEEVGSAVENAAVEHVLDEIGRTLTVHV